MFVKIGTFAADWVAGCGSGITNTLGDGMAALIKPKIADSTVLRNIVTNLDNTISLIS